MTDVMKKGATEGREGRWRGLATALVGALSLPVGLVVLAAFVPIPILSILAAALSSRIIALALVSTVILLAALWLLRRAPSRGRRAVTTIAAAGFFGSVVIASEQFALAAREGVAIDLLAAVVPPKRDVTPDASVVFMSFEGTPISLSVWRPVGTTGRLAPVVLIVHGGGWSEGSRLDGAPPTHARWFADQGFLAVSADYSLSSQDRQLWDVQESQIGCALVWIVANASTYGGDSGRLALVGDSAGGNLVLNVAARIGAGTLSPACSGPLPAILATSTLYPAADPYALYDNSDVVMGPVARAYLTNYTGGSPDQFPDRYAAIDPAMHVTAAMPPALITLGSHDHLVPPAATRDFVEMLRAADVEARLIQIPHGEHVFDLEGAIGTQIWRASTLAWFREHGL